jgi:hypothetical protein
MSIPCHLFKISNLWKQQNIIYVVVIRTSLLFTQAQIKWQWLMMQIQQNSKLQLGLLQVSLNLQRLIGQCPTIPTWSIWRCLCHAHHLHALLSLPCLVSRAGSFQATSGLSICTQHEAGVQLLVALPWDGVRFLLGILLSGSRWVRYYGKKSLTPQVLSVTWSPLPSIPLVCRGSMQADMVVSLRLVFSVDNLEAWSLRCVPSIAGIFLSLSSHSGSLLLRSKASQ